MSQFHDEDMQRAWDEAEAAERERENDPERKRRERERLIKWAFDRRVSKTNAVTGVHQIQDRGGVEVCSCGYVPRGANASRLSQSSDAAARLLREHIHENDDHLCHHSRYGLECILPRGHDGLHRDAAYVG